MAKKSTKNFLFIIKGRKWWDKVNGNTYNSAQIYILKNGECCAVLHCPFEYGYGSDYAYRARFKIKDWLIVNGYGVDFSKIHIFDCGADYDKKKNVREFLY